MSFVIINGDHYIESHNIRVFPSAYRGQYSSSTSPATALVFDPEARATTESNFTSTFHKLSKNKESYVVAWIPDTSGDKGTLKCVIGGYYFEIYNHSMADFFYTVDRDSKPYYLCIKTDTIELGTAEPDTSSARQTKVLSSFTTGSNYLDVKNNEDKYGFTGLLISKEPAGTASLLPFTSGKSYIEAGTASQTTDEDKDAQLGKWYFNTGTSKMTQISASNPAPDGTQLYIKTTDYKVDPNKLVVTDLLDVGSAPYSLRMRGEMTDQGSTTTRATGAYSIALGKHTESTGEASIALGNNTKTISKGAFAAGNNTVAGSNTVAGNIVVDTGEGAVAMGNGTIASGKSAFAAGNNTTAKNEGSVALGSYTETNATNQIVIGKYNQLDSNQAFIIAAGTNAEDATANKFTVSYDGDVKALGKLEVNGNKIITVEEGLDTEHDVSLPAISSTGSGANDFVLGTATQGSYGSIKVFGENLPNKITDEGGNEIQPDKIPVFKVESTGNTTIAGDTVITKDTQSDNTTSGALTVSGGVGITKNLNVGGDTTLNGTLTVGSGKKTTLSDQLEVIGTTTLNDALNVADGKATTLGGTLKVKQATELKGSLTVDDKTTLNSNLTVSGEIQLDKADTEIKGDKEEDPSTYTTNNNLVIGKPADTSNKYSGTISVYGTGTDKVFSVENTGATTIKGITTIDNTTDFSKKADDTFESALVVKGGVGIDKKLYVGKDTYIGGNINLSKNLVLTGGSDTHTVTIGHKNPDEPTDKSAGSLTIYTTGGNIGFRVDEAGNSSLYNRLTINSETEASGETRLLVGGNATVEGALTANSLNAKSLNLTNADADSVQEGDIKATNIAAEKLTLGTGNNVIYLDTTDSSQISVPNLEIFVGEGANQHVTVNGKFKTTGFTTLANTVTIGSSDLPKYTNYGNINNVYNLNAENQITATTFNAKSDARKKTNIQDYSCQNSILDLPIKSFEYINDDTHKKYIGCLAQDLQEICPELVDTDKEGFLSIQETKLVYLLLQEVKSLKQQLEEKFKN